MLRLSVSCWDIDCLGADGISESSPLFEWYCRDPGLFHVTITYDLKTTVYFPTEFIPW